MTRWAVFASIAVGFTVGEVAWHVIAGEDLWQSFKPVVHVMMGAAMALVFHYIWDAPE